MNAYAHHRHVGAYARNENASVHGRTAEGRAFAKAARLLDALKRAPSDTALRARAIGFNRVLWTALQADVGGQACALPAALKANLLSLSLYVDRALLALPVSRADAPLEALIEINRNVAAGLLAVPPATTPTA